MGLRIVILGAPGAGKGTQAKRIAVARAIPHISTGDIFRGHLKEDSPWAREIRPHMDAGELVPDALTCLVVEQRLAEPDCADGCVLDGFPRSVPQAEALDGIFARRAERLDVAIEIRMPDDAIVDRLTARRVCPVCGAIYNVKSNPPRKDPGRCDRNACAGVLVRRPDDYEDTIRQRLAVYEQTAEPIYAYYREHDLLRSVQGDTLPPDAVFAKVEEIFYAMGVA